MWITLSTPLQLEKVLLFIQFTCYIIKIAINKFEKGGFFPFPSPLITHPRQFFLLKMIPWGDLTNIWSVCLVSVWSSWASFNASQNKSVRQWKLLIVYQALLTSSHIHHIYSTLVCWYNLDYFYKGAVTKSHGVGYIKLKYIGCILMRLT